MLEYIWIDGFGNPRSKTKVHSTPLQGTDCLNQIPEWNYDGSSTGQASGNDSEVIKGYLGNCLKDISELTSENKNTERLKKFGIKIILHLTYSFFFNIHAM